jgi:hypothetical protein
MRTMPASITQAWRGGVYVGDRKPIARVTIQHPTMESRKYSLTSTYSFKKNATLAQILAGESIDFAHTRKVNQLYTNFLFATTNKAGTTPHPPVIKHKIGRPKELPNVKSVNWTRSIDADVADCSIELLNTFPRGSTDKFRDELDEPGYFTYDRGGSAVSTRWHLDVNEWFGLIVPDNIVRTYEGYGCDMSVAPEKDPHLVLTGVWLIDSVNYTDTGTMSIKARDMGRILIDQLYYPPVVPNQWYDNTNGWEGWDDTFPQGDVFGKLKVKATRSSNFPWPGNETIAGHKLADAFDGNPSTYWLSVGNVQPSRRFAYEWVECSVGNKSVSQVKFRTKKKGYVYYISVLVGGVWQGANVMNYHEDGIGRNDDDIAYIETGTVNTEDFVTVKFKKTYKKVQRVRVSLGNLQFFPNIGTYHYRGGIRDVEVYGSTKVADKKLDPGPAGSNPGRYSDYTDIVKILCAWGGFFWPENSYWRNCDGEYVVITPTKFDELCLGKGVRGRVWGDFQQAGLAGVALLEATNFDKKSLMDGISFIRDQLGFIFYIDESGAVQWRLPNVFNYGCQPTLSGKTKYLKGVVHQIDENSVLLSLSATISSSNVRESFFVGDVEGKLGAFAPGFNPNPTGLRRMAGWTDANFSVDFSSATDPAGKNAQKQAQLTADMLSLRQLFTYRKDRVRIPANPAIQIDDQMRIFEETTAEGYIHYVQGISSTLDMTSGEWTYDIDTHWLGYDGPTSKWLFDQRQLAEVSQKYLDKIELLTDQYETLVRDKQGVTRA